MNIVLETLKKNLRAKRIAAPPIITAIKIPGKPVKKRRETKNSISLIKTKVKDSEVREIKPAISSIKTIRGDFIILFLFIN